MELACKDAGALSCRGRIKGRDEEEFKRKLLKHLKDHHGVTEANDTILDYLASVAGHTHTARNVSR